MEIALATRGDASGAEGNRTPDPFHAMEVLYQLSYSPERTEDDTSGVLPLKAAGDGSDRVEAAPEAAAGRHQA